MVKKMCLMDFVQINNPFDEDASINEAAVTALKFLAGSNSHQARHYSKPKELAKQSHALKKEL